MRKLRDRRLVGVTVACGAALALVVACSSDDTDDGGNTAGSSGAGASGSSAGGKGGTTGTSGSANGGTSAGGTAHGGGGAANGGTTNGGTGGKAGGGTGGATGGAAGAGEAGAGEGGDMGAAGAGGAAPFVPVAIPLLNAGFETGPDNMPAQSWQASGDVVASYVNYKQDAAHSGYGRLALWTDTKAYKVSTFQTVAVLANGTYVLSAYLTGATSGINSLYLYATGYNGASTTDQVKADVVVTGSYVQYSLTDIHVTSGTLTVGVYIDAGSGVWTNVDDITLTRVE